MESNAAQHSLDWFRQRLGNFTGSEVGNLFVKSKKKDEMFGQTAMKYIYKKSAERMIDPMIIEDDLLLSNFIEQNNPSTKSMQWGTEKEPEARECYKDVKGYDVVEVGSIKHKSIPHFASSPDGFIYDEDKEERGCLEIKCLSLDNFVLYMSESKDADGLKKVEPKYYYQCMAHMACTESNWCDFAVFNPYLINPIHIIRIFPDEEVYKEFGVRINAANQIIDNIIKDFK